MLKAILWDNDGVLVDTETLYYRANRETLAEIGIELTEEQYLSISLDQGQSVVNLARYRGCTDEQISDLRQKRDLRYIGLLKQGVRVFPGVEETLRFFHGKIAMGLVTSSPRPYFDVIHRQTGFLPFFNLILTREDYEKAKPDPEPYLKALERSGLEPGECVVIEDTKRGLEASRAAGIPCIIIPNSYTRHQGFSGAWHVISDIRKLPSLIGPPST
ncbi:HAD family phosphatase [bacterium]|nr:HAD family phosphatase [bacterium]